MQNDQQLYAQYIKEFGTEEKALYETAMTLRDRGEDKASFCWLKKAARIGYAPAHYELGNFYYIGYGIEANMSEAFHYYQCAALQGHADAANNLADMYLNGESTDVDEQQALKWFFEAADRGIAEAMFTLGLMHEKGLGTAVDTERAYQFYKQSAEHGYEDGQYYMGMIHLEGLLEREMSEAEAIRWFLAAAKQFHVDAIFNLGYIYEQARESKKAIHYYKQAALLGDYQAKCNLADIYNDGVLVAKNTEEASKWEQAAQKQLDEDKISDL